MTSLSAGVPFSGLHLAIKSGRGRPTAFLITSVINEVRNNDMKRPRIVTFVLWPSRLVRRINRRIETRGSPMLYTNSQTVRSQSWSPQLLKDGFPYKSELALQEHAGIGWPRCSR